MTSSGDGRVKGRLPSFFVVGAQKAGTTTLHDWLVQQPDVCLPKLKETTFFSNDKVYSYGLDWYMRQFPQCGGDAFMGEICPAYMFIEKAPERIHESIKTPKIIFVLRSPLDRAYSHYQMIVRRGLEKLTFKDALLAEKERLSGGDYFKKTHYSYMARGRYEEQILRYKRVLPESEALFVSFDDLFGPDTSAQTYERICKFIGIKSSPAIADRTVVSNRASEPRSTLLNRLLYFKPGTIQYRVMRAVLRPLPIELLAAAKSRLDGLNQKHLEKKNSKAGAIPVPEESYLEAVREIEATERITGLSLGFWVDRLEKKYCREA